MSELTDRQKLLLTLIIHEFTREANPIGSKSLVEQYHLDMSPATVRNEMGILTDLGYLRQPHTSAGRIPTEHGFRFFVGNLLQTSDLPTATQKTISHQFYQMKQDVEQWMRLAVSLLAKHSQATSLITAPQAERTLFKHVELISTHGRQLLMVLVLMGGDIRQRMITLGEPVSQEMLSQAADEATVALAGKTRAAIPLLASKASGLLQELYGSIAEEMDFTEARHSGELYLDGLSNVFSEPEFTADEARGALKILEERTTLQLMLSELLNPNTVNTVQVLIGGEGNLDELKQCSIVLSRYGAPGLATGTLGVLGPLRMEYGKTISTVRYVSELLSELVTDSLTYDN